jgi:crotonobetainyl-CoA:carnitine CoA-transferase CaiB-like acyl-CoA transferase
VYEAADGKWLSIAASNQAIAERLFEAMGRPELLADPRYATNDVRMEHNDELQEIVKAWVAERPRAQVLDILDKFEVVCSQVNDASDIVEDPHFRARTLVDLAGVQALGKALMPGAVLHVEGYPGPSYVGVPSIGQHTDEVLTELLGYDERGLAELAAGGAIRRG